MSRLSLNQLTTYRWGFEEQLVDAARHGFDAVGVWRRKVDDFGAQRAAHLTHDVGLDVSCLTWAGGFTGIDGRSLDESIADTRRAIELAASLGARCLVLYPGGRNNHIDRHAVRLLKLALDEVLLVAESAGVTLALKPMDEASSGEWSFIRTLEHAVAVANDYDSPSLGVVYDTYQFPKLPPDRGFLANLVRHLALVQLADARQPTAVSQECCPLGRGHIPLAHLVATLDQLGYRGFYEVRLLGMEIEATDCTRLLTWTKRAWAKLQTEAATAGRSTEGTMIAASPID